MDLSVVERLVLLNLLPQEGSYINLKLLRTAREELSFSDEEVGILNFVQEGDQVRWNMEADVIKDVTIGEVVTLMIVDSLKKLDGEGKLKNDHFSLFEKFCV